MPYKVTIQYRAKGKCSKCGKKRQVTTFDRELAKAIKQDFKDGVYVCSDHEKEAEEREA